MDNAVREEARQELRQRDHAQLRDVGAMIEFRRARRCRRGWQRNPQLFPVTLRRVAQLLQRRTQYVLHDDGTGVRRDDDTFGADGTVRDIARTFVQRGDRRDDLLNQALCRVDVDRDRAPVIRGQKVGKSHAAREPGHHRQGGGGFAEAVDAANRGQLTPEAQELSRVAARVGDATTLTETVPKIVQIFRRRYVRSDSPIHIVGSLRQRRPLRELCRSSRHGLPRTTR